MREGKDGRMYCDKPDRDWRPNPKRPNAKPTPCGYPMPCPWHTLILDLSTGAVTVPAQGTIGQTRRVREIGEALQGVQP
jgi:hypothetical protein